MRRILQPKRLRASDVDAPERASSARQGPASLRAASLLPPPTTSLLLSSSLFLPRPYSASLQIQLLDTSLRRPSSLLGLPASAPSSLACPTIGNVPRRLPAPFHRGGLGVFLCLHDLARRRFKQMTDDLTLSHRQSDHLHRFHIDVFFALSSSSPSHLGIIIDPACHPVSRSVKSSPWVV